MHGHLSSCSPWVCWKTIVKALLEHSPRAQVGPHRCSVSLCPRAAWVILYHLWLPRVPVLTHAVLIPVSCFLVGLKPFLYRFLSWIFLSHSVVSLMRGVDNVDFAVCAFWVLDDMTVLGQILCHLVFLYSFSYPHVYIFYRLLCSLLN